MLDNHFRKRNTGQRLNFKTLFLLRVEKKLLKKEVMYAVFIRSISKKRVKDVDLKRPKEVERGSKNSVVPCN